MQIWNRPAKDTPAIGMINRKFPRVILSEEAAGRMEALVSCCKIEISWLATVDRVGNDFLIDQLIIPPQKCSWGGTDFFEGDYLQTFIGADGKIPNDVLRMISRLRAWGHSHHNMAVYPSGTDEKQTDVFLENTEDYFIRLICNKRGEMHVSLYLLDIGIVLFQPKLICRKPKAVKGQQVFARELYPFDDWALAEIEEKVEQYHMPLNASDFTEEELALLELGRELTDEFPNDFPGKPD